MDKAGVLWPADFHSWNMMTAYWNFEQALIYFTGVYDGTDTNLLLNPRVLYWGVYKNLNISDPDLQDEVDNAFYYPYVRAFVLTPFKNFDKVPLSMNLGVIGHEVAHRVFHQKASANKAVPIWHGWDGAPYNILQSLDEGLADYHAYGVVCRSQMGPGCTAEFLAPSFDDTTVRQRNFSRREHCMTQELRTAYTSKTKQQFTEKYLLGTLFATALYQASHPIQQDAIMQKAVIKAMDDPSTGNPGLQQVIQANLASIQNISLEKVSDVLLAHIPDTSLRVRACSELWGRLSLRLPHADVTHCPPTAQPTTDCTLLP
jgi:hypothetical protein